MISYLNALKIALLYTQLYAVKEDDMEVLKKLQEEEWCERVLKLGVQELSKELGEIITGRDSRQKVIEELVESIEEVKKQGKEEANG